MSFCSSRKIWNYQRLTGAIGEHLEKSRKASHKEGSICKAPGLVDAMCVVSETATRPHFVSKLKNGIFAGDESCIAWKSQKFCSHVLAVCEQKQCLEE